MRFLLTKRLSPYLHHATASASPSPSSLPPSRRYASLISVALTDDRRSQPSVHHAFRRVLAAPWSAIQYRGLKLRGSDVKPGQIIEKRGKVYEVLKAQHSCQGRGGAVIQVELRDVDSGNKTNERLRTDEAIERVFVVQKPYNYLYTEDDIIVLMEPNTFEQVDLPKDMLGEAVAYLKGHTIPRLEHHLHCQSLAFPLKKKGKEPTIYDMKVNVQLYDGKPVSASIPQRVTCKVVEAQAPIKGIGATPHTKKVLLDNGLTVQVPPFILAGEEIVINTLDNTYMTRA
ncbi:uncharacterized protein LOC132306138 isoform X2 [Cornus florida]|uniref:uncharacterized protein LOC132306138 isoform X2 n=1 Tax=Cornus florida TaxID=4283 RepID=UPI00289F4F7F|nr:uncharacterized protein LOC132306138 isoform X2 [Cornus florida]